MPKKILIIDSDAALVAQLSQALQGHGFSVVNDATGKNALEVARAERPDAIVLCVELPRASGFGICSKLKKDEQLRQIPVLLTSAEATEKTFEDHRRLKSGRADDYLRKPFSTAKLVEQVAALTGEVLSAEEAPALEESNGVAPQAPGQTIEEQALAALNDLGERLEQVDNPSDADEPISFDEVEELEVEEDSAPTSESLPTDQDVEMLDAVFSRLETGAEAPLGPSHGLKPSANPQSSALDAAEETQPLTRLRDLDAPGLKNSRVGSDETDSLLAALAGKSEVPAPRSASGSRDRDYFQQKERLAQRERELLRLREELTAKEKELVEQRDRETALERELAEKDEEIGRRDSQLQELKQRAEALIASQRRNEKEIASAREDRQRNEELTAELGQLRTQLEGANQTIQEFHQRVSDLEERQTQSDGRMVKAYQRLKDEEKLRDKTRKALGIALQLLEEPVGESDEEASTA